MRTFTRRVVLAVLGFSIAGIAALGEARQGQTVDPALKQAADARNAARQAGDAAAYARYILDDAYFTNGSGEVVNKETRVAAVKSGKPATFKVSDEKYRMLGDAAVHTYRTDGTSGQGQKEAFRMLEVWAKQGGEWKIAAVALGPIAKP